MTGVGRVSAARPWPRASRPASSPHRPKVALGVAPPSRQLWRGTGRKAGRAASLLRGAFFQPVLEPAIEVGVDRQVVGEKLRVDLHHLGEALVFLPTIDADGSHDERHGRKNHARREPAPAPAVAEHVVRPAHCGSYYGNRLGTLARKRRLARGLKLLHHGGVERASALVQDLADAAGEMQFVHGFVRTPAHRVTPRALSAAAKACVAREQWVLTLPSEQPMTCAV